MNLEIKKKKIDIICPVYNKSDVVDDFIKSCLKNVNFEYFNLIIINDGSKDDTLNILQLLVGSTDGIYIIDKKNTGVSSTRNEGLLISKSDYIWFCDPDDQICVDGMELIQTISSGADLYVFRYITHYMKNNKEIVSSTFIDNKLTFKDFFIKYNYFSDKNQISTLWNKLYKRESLIDVHFDTELSNAEDRLFNIKTLEKYGVVEFSQSIIYKHNRYENGTLSTVKSRKKISDIAKVNYINLEGLGKYRDIKKEKKKHIITMCKEKVIYGDNLLVNFYIKEHKRIGLKIFPLSNVSELVFLVPFLSIAYKIRTIIKRML